MAITADDIKQAIDFVENQLESQGFVLDAVRGMTPTAIVSAYPGTESWRGPRALSVEVNATVVASSSSALPPRIRRRDSIIEATMKSMEFIEWLKGWRKGIDFNGSSMVLHPFREVDIQANVDEPDEKSLSAKWSVVFQICDDYPNAR